MANDIVKAGNKNVTKSDTYMPPLPLVRFIEALLSPEIMGNIKKAEKATGCYRQKFYYHWKHPEFRQYYVEQVDRFLRSSEAIAAGKLVDAIREGDVAAIKLFYEIIGRIRGGSISLSATFNNDARPLIIESTGEPHPFLKDLPNDKVKIIMSLADIALFVMTSQDKDEDIPLEKLKFIFDLVKARSSLVRKILDGLIKSPEPSTAGPCPGAGTGSGPIIDVEAEPC